jgi:hypothetical protein
VNTSDEERYSGYSLPNGWIFREADRDVVVAIDDEIVMRSANIPFVGFDIRKEASPLACTNMVLAVIFL